METNPNWSGWNINKGYYDHVADIIIDIDIAAYSDNPFAWLKLLRILYRKVKGRLAKNHPAEINKMENDFKAVRAKLNMSDLLIDSQETRSIKINRINSALKLLDTLETDLLDLMHIEELLPTKLERTPPNKAIEDMGL